MYLEILGLPRLCFATRLVQTNYRNRLTAKANTAEIWYIREGSLTIKSDSSSFEVGREAFLFKAPEAEWTLCGDGLLDCLHLCFWMDYARHSCDAAGRLLIDPQIPLSASGASACLSLINGILERQNCSRDRTMAFAGQILQLLGEMDRVTRHLHGTCGSKNTYVQQAKQMILADLCRPVCQKELAKTLGITPQYLCTLFKRSEGVTLMRFVNRRKLEAVAGMMRQEGVSLRCAAERYGFEDANYVSRLYKQQFGRNITDAV